MDRVTIFNVDGYDGKRLEGWFDRDRAECFDSAREWDGNNLADINVGANRWQDLYRTAGGRWVLSNRSAWQGEETTYEFVSDERAREWLIANDVDGDHDEALEKYFGPVEEERGPGRPEIGPAINMRLPRELLESVDALAKDEGKSRAEMVRELLAAGMIHIDRKRQQAARS